MTKSSVQSMSLVICLLFSCNSIQQSAEHDFLNIEFNGTIDSVYLDPEGRMQPVVILNQTKYSIRNKIYEEFKKGDTLYKSAGSMKYYWIKNGDTVLFFQKYGKYDLTDSGQVLNLY